MPEQIVRMVTVRIRATGQVAEFLPDVARALLSGGVGEEVSRSRQPENAMVEPARERAISQTAARKKK